MFGTKSKEQGCHRFFIEKSNFSGFAKYDTLIITQNLNSLLEGFYNSCSYCKVIIIPCCLTLLALHKRKSVLCKYEEIIVSGETYTFRKLFRVQKCCRILLGLYLISYHYYYHYCYHYHYCCHYH